MSKELHARLGPSNKRWPKCPGSVREEEGYPDMPSEAAISGTGSHLLLELCLKNDVPALSYDQQVIGVNHPDKPGGWLISLDRIERVQMALDYVNRRVADLKSSFPHCNVTVEPESRSDPGGAFGRDDWWGTCDITIIARHNMTGQVYAIEVADYKDGRAYVSEKDNSQNISYLFGRLRPYITESDGSFSSSRVDNCRMTIIQPKTTPVIRYVCTTRKEDAITVSSVINDAVALSKAAKDTDDKDAPLVPGDHCRWCKANPKRGGHCVAATNQSIKAIENINPIGKSQIQSYFNKILTDVKSLTEAQLSEVADTEAGFQSVFDTVKKEIENRIDQGVNVPGYMKLPGRETNKWNQSDEVIAKKLRSRKLKNSEIYPSKLISPAQVMKLDQLNQSQKERIKSELITTVAGKLTLKKVSYEKTKNVEKMFSNISETPEVSFL